MKIENFKNTKAYTSDIPENGTVFEKFIYWFKDFLNNSE